MKTSKDCAKLLLLNLDFNLEINLIDNWLIIIWETKSEGGHNKTASLALNYWNNQ